MIQKIFNDLHNKNIREISSLFAIFLLLLHLPHDWFLITPIGILGLLGLLSPKAREEGSFWFLAFIVIASYIYWGWYHVDNHIYVIAYLCLTLGLSFKLNSEEVLVKNGRLLVGWVMLLSCVWKAVSVDYLSGNFFHFTILTDDRFALFTSLFTGTPVEEIISNGFNLDDLTGGHLHGNPMTQVPLYSNSKILGMAQFLTWWTIIIETLIGLSFVSNRIPIFSKYRDPLLIVFALSTYSVATVSGFAWVILTMAFAQTTDDQVKTRAWYLITMICIEVFGTPTGAFTAKLLDYFN